MEPQKNSWLKWVAIAAAVIIVAGVGYWYWQQRHGETTQKIGDNQELHTAAAGTVVNGFPKELILENTLPSESYSIYLLNDNAQQPVLRYTSQKSFADNVVMFRDFFTQNGWYMAHVASEYERPISYFYAFKDGDQVNVTFEDKDGKVLVNIAYVQQQ